MALPCNNLGLNQVNSLYGIYQFQQIGLNDYYVRVTNGTCCNYGGYSDMFQLRNRNAWGSYGGSPCYTIHVWGDVGFCGCGDPYSGCCCEYDMDYVNCYGGNWTNTSASDWEAWGCPEGDVCSLYTWATNSKGWSSQNGTCGSVC